MRFLSSVRGLFIGGCAWALAVGCSSGTPSPSTNVGTTSQAIIGGLGDVTVSTAGSIVNRYAVLASDAALGATTLTVTNGPDLGAIAAGDLLMIIQMQGATIDTTNSATYGAVSALNGAGSYELVTAASISGNTVTLNSGCGLKNAYKAASHTQVIWVPQYDVLTVSGAGTITAPAWDGTKGGIVAIQANSMSLTAPGAINVAGLGFRGGVVDQNTNGPVTGAPSIVSTNSAAGSEKGESIVGFEAEYDAANGRYGIGAPANGGGGGGPHNSGGGGGANGNNGATWTGAGVMSTTVTGASAWALDPDDILNLGTTTSSGGGRGGYSYAGASNDPTLVGPGNALWGGDDRQSHGGRGGRPLTNSALSTLSFGGGGGAGDSNNSAGTSGAPGGGLVFALVATGIDGAGTGTIVADGATAATTILNMTLSGNDAPGGGGAGGTVVLVTPSVTNLGISAAGGAGGNQNITGNEAEGPGGGGGGGFIAVPSGATVTTPAGGPSGTTNSPIVTGFPDNGGTNGATGQVASIATDAKGPVCIGTDLSLSISDGGGTAVPGDTVTYTIVVTNNGASSVTGATVTDTFATSFSAESWTCAGAACPAASGTGPISATLGALAPAGTATFSVIATVDSNATGTLSNTASVAAPAGFTDSVPANNSATVTNSLSGSADLAVTVTSTPTSGITTGQAFSYTVAVDDTIGPSDAYGVEVIFAIPPGASYVGESGTGWTCTPFLAPNLICTNPTIAAGTTSDLVVNVTAPTTVGTTDATATIQATTSDPSTANNHFTDSITFGCTVDNDCGSADWCNAGACTLKTPNGTVLPSASPINSTCSTTNAARVCQTGVCDTNGNVCGIKLGDKTCTTTTECISGNCVTSGPNSGTCVACATSADCASPTAICNPTTNTCVQCSAADSSACSGTTPLCGSAGACVACNGDHGSSATAACTASAPYCTTTGASTGTCTTCTADAMCTTGTHAGPLCDLTTGACGTICSSDAQCTTNDWCDNLVLGTSGTCQPKVASGDPVPGGSCVTSIAMRACLSGVCDVTSKDCGTVAVADAGAGDAAVDAAIDAAVDAGNDAALDAGSDAAAEVDATTDAAPTRDGSVTADASRALGETSEGAALKGGGCSAAPGNGARESGFAASALVFGLVLARRRKRAR